MKNLKWNKVFSLCKIQVAEFSEVFSKRILLLPIFILLWPLLTSGGDTLSSCNTIARWILMVPIVLIPIMNYAYFIVGSNKLMLPASPTEKYTSIWLAGFVLTVVGIILLTAIILPLLYVLNVVSFQEDFTEIGHSMLYGRSFSEVLSFFAFSTGTVLLVSSQFISKSKKRMIYMVLVLSFVLYLALLFLLPNSVKDMSIALLSGFLSICFWVWGYQCFKLSQSYKKK